MRSAEKGGTPTYRAADVAYLVDKLDRGFDRAIYVLGADHHATARWYAAIARMLGYDPERVEVLLYQFVHLMRGGEATKVSKRARQRRLPRRFHRRDRRRRGALVPRQSRPRPDDRDRPRPRSREIAEEPGLLRPVRARPDRGDLPERRGGRDRWPAARPARRRGAGADQAADRVSGDRARGDRAPRAAAAAGRTRSGWPTTSIASTTSAACSATRAQSFRLGLCRATQRVIARTLDLSGSKRLSGCDARPRGLRSAGVDPPDDLLDVRLGDLQVDEKRLGRDPRGQLGGGAPKAQPLARAVDPLDPCARKLERRRGLLQVDDQGALCAVPFLQVGYPAVLDQLAVIDHEQAVGRAARCRPGRGSSAAP